MGKIGLIMNTMAGRDIRRLVAAASLQSSPEKMMATRRILTGIGAVEGSEVYMIDDFEGFGRYVASELSSLVSIKLLAYRKEPSYGVMTTDWIRRLEEEDVALTVVVGGDGTQRNAAQASPQRPILPIAGGTNNVACWTGDQTAAGYAAALYAKRGDDPAQVGLQSKLIRVRSEAGHEEIALIDVALVYQQYTGALAVWHAHDVFAMVLAVADPTRPGLSNVGGFVHPVFPDQDCGLYMTMDEAPDGELSNVAAVLAPGLMASFSVKSSRLLDLDETIEIRMPEGGSVALDGERTFVIRPEELLYLTLSRTGPYMLDPAKILSMSLASN